MDSDIYTIHALIEAGDVETLRGLLTAAQQHRAGVRGGREESEAVTAVQRLQMAVTMARQNTARLATSRETLATLAAERVTVNGRSWTVADLQAALARETER